jgi:hypothetical protein
LEYTLRTHFLSLCRMSSSGHPFRFGRAFRSAMLCLRFWFPRGLNPPSILLHMSSTIRPLLCSLLPSLSIAIGAGAQSLPPLDQQIAAAVLPLPADMRAGAKVLGYRSEKKLETIRDGKNGMICLALYVTRPDFHVACYHEGLEPFMARGRDLRDQGVADANVDSVRFREIRAGTLKMPSHGALYSLTGPKSSWDPAAHKVSGARPLTVLYMPFATPESTGLSTRPPADGGPWLMLPGTPKAHVMMVGSMQ